MSDSIPQPPPPGAPPSGSPNRAETSASSAATTGAAAKVSFAGSAGLGLLSAVLLAVAVSVKEDGNHGWSRFGVWAGFAIASALATTAPAWAPSLRMSTVTAWRTATAGGIGLAVYWVLFVLPWIEQNVSFVATVGCALGMYAAWIAPGRPRSARAQAF